MYFPPLLPSFPPSLLPSFTPSLTPALPPPLQFLHPLLTLALLSYLMLSLTNFGLMFDASPRCVPHEVLRLLLLLLADLTLSYHALLPGEATAGHSQSFSNSICLILSLHVSIFPVPYICVYIFVYTVRTYSTVQMQVMYINLHLSSTVYRPLLPPSLYFSCLQTSSFPVVSNMLTSLGFVSITVTICLSLLGLDKSGFLSGGGKASPTPLETVCPPGNSES